MSTVTRVSCSQQKEMDTSGHSAYLSSDLASKLDDLFKYSNYKGSILLQGMCIAP